MKSIFKKSCEINRDVLCQFVRAGLAPVARCCFINKSYKEYEVMLRTANWFLLVITLLSFSTSSVGHQPIIRGEGSPLTIPGRYIVVFKDESEIGRLEKKERASRISREFGAKVNHSYNALVKGAAVTIDYAGALRLARDPSVLYVEADSEIHIDAIQSPTQWNLDRIDQFSLPLNQTYRYPNSAGAGVHVYIVDSGIRSTHAEFIGRMGNGVDKVTFRDPEQRWDLRLDTTEDCNGHGTHVAAIAAGTQYGVAKKATIHPVRVVDCMGGAKLSDVTAGLDWILSNHLKPAVVNMSLGGTPSPTLDNYVSALLNAGLTVVVSAGNDSGDACLKSPARVPAAITVASVDITDQLSHFSNYGSCVDIKAPGTAIKSAGIGSDSDVKESSGTSMSAPHVAGVAALLLGQDPLLSVNQIANKILANAGQNGVLSTANFYLGDVTIPAQVPNILANKTFCYGENHVFWQAISGATRYELFMATSTIFSDPMLVVSTSATSFTGNFDLGTNLKVRACNVAGCSALSLASATTKYHHTCE